VLFYFLYEKMKDSITQIKVWLFPSVITLLAAIIWNDVQEIKADVKALMAQSNIDKTRIDNLEREVYKAASSFPTKNNKPMSLPMSHLAILPNNRIQVIK